MRVERRHTDPPNFRNASGSGRSTLIALATVPGTNSPFRPGASDGPLLGKDRPYQGQWLDRENSLRGSRPTSANFSIITLDERRDKRRPDDFERLVNEHGRGRQRHQQHVPGVPRGADLNSRFPTYEYDKGPSQKVRVAHLTRPPTILLPRHSANLASRCIRLARLRNTHAAAHEQRDHVAHAPLFCKISSPLREHHSALINWGILVGAPGLEPGTR